MAKRRKFPDVRKKFKVGDNVCTSYQYPGERKRKYSGTVTGVGKDWMDVRWKPSGREIRSWDFAIFKGSGFTAAVKKCRR